MISKFFTIFISILLETIPFILIGAIISSLIQMFVSEDFIKKIIPKNMFLALIATSFLGIIFPVCECAIIPIARRLMKKGVPLPIAITFMLSVPIVNPIVIMSTYYAFTNKPIIFFMRLLFGIINSIVIGYLIHISYKDKESPLKETKEIHNCSCSCCHHDHNNEEHNHKEETSKIRELLTHTKIELFSVFKYLAFGAFISSLFKVAVKEESFEFLGSNIVLSIVVMIILAIVLSVCSEADAFIASAFTLKFTTGSILAFLVLGPMIDIKNIAMLLGNFKKSFVIRLSIYIIAVTFISTLLFNLLGGV